VCIIDEGAGPKHEKVNKEESPNPGKMLLITSLDKRA
jgi:hypothetical protein